MKDRIMKAKNSLILAKKKNDIICSLQTVLFCIVTILSIGAVELRVGMIIIGFFLSTSYFCRGKMIGFLDAHNMYSLSIKAHESKIASQEQLIESLKTKCDALERLLVNVQKLEALSEEIGK